ncbi:Scr1 family TA system antitoxin-like transcriptional regulator [Actinoplanes xinjiangensis]|uniref:Scr1 family TA system antitoxin-like transcriptional regulator n=1 Tax=Actinoplanes xinjiangensis TaxID=512350 RepID=UPI001EF31AB0|nr:Scr1 family TA system antitoxin-like transcriptional regulator [Actinoplanes xinjiangensis]
MGEVPRRDGTAAGSVRRLEVGARSITEFHLTLLPGLLQIPEFTEVRARANRGIRPEAFDPTCADERVAPGGRFR